MNDEVRNTHVQYEDKAQAEESTITYSEHHKLVNAALSEQNSRALALQLATSTVAASEVVSTAAKYLSFLSGDGFLSETELDKMQHDYFMTGYAKGQNDAIEGAARGAQNGVRTAVQIATADTLLKVRTALTKEYARYSPSRQVTVEQAYDRAIDIIREVENA